MPYLRTARLALCCFLCASFADCNRAGDENERKTADAGSSQTFAPEKKETGWLAFDGVTPPKLASAELPGSAGPFVEPPLLERPTQIHHVVVDCVPDLEEAAALDKASAGIAAVPVGYPAIDWAGDMQGADCKWVVLAGKFARPEFARVLRDVLRKAGMKKTTVVVRSYRHDRFSPTLGSGANRHVGRVFAGVAGVGVPLLMQPSQAAHGAGELPDGTLVEITGRKEQADKTWYNVRTGSFAGFLPAARLLAEFNVYPSPDGRRAIIALSLGCRDGACPRDYWLVGREFSPRRLLCPQAERLGHAFSVDGARLAFACPGRPLTIVFDGRRADLNLGSGTSPSWSSDGGLLFFRSPGVGGKRDDVQVARTPAFQVETFFDFHGQPFYPRSLSAYPPPVDVLDGGKKLYTMFYRLVRRDGGVSIQRWKVLLSPTGKLISKKGEQLTE
ncbi:MAG TPA: hypothetical protein VM425_03475 [Myxococcota bacterium]|nr:hypothetical protein [Myxococcota bacterium]